MSGISLTASMRSNLLSLQNIASQQDIVQNRLAIGLKVSSAIDTPSSYYTASSLNNRVADLTALLDSMSQGIQTIKAASEAIDSGTKFLEQAKAVANNALNGVNPPDKNWFSKLTSAHNGILVSSAQELKDAVNAGHELIVIYGQIDYFENESITLQENQKLVGTEYLAQFDPAASYRDLNNNRISTLNIKITSSSNNGIEIGNNGLIANLNINHENLYTDAGICGAVAITGNKTAEISDVNINSELSTTRSNIRGALFAFSSATLTIRGTNNITTKGANNYGVFNLTNSTVNITERCTLNISASNNVFAAIGSSAGSITKISGKLNIQNENFLGIINLSGSTTVITSTAEIKASAKAFFRNASSSTADKLNILIIEAGALLDLTENTTSAILRSDGYRAEDYTSVERSLKISTMIDSGHFQKLEPEPEEIKENKKYLDYQALYNQFNTIVFQYNRLTADAAYKGINLLKGQNLKVNFNEDRSSKIDIAGVKADSESLGLKTKEWKTAEDIEQSISELENAINSLRGFASEFGNYYSIVTTRQDFTENLINVLEEGADKLTLADMNQESANMLALQTSQQLAVNSLSLASQASQSILKLF